MADAPVTPDAAPSPAHATVFRDDYRPPDWLVPEVELDFDLAAGRTTGRARLTVERNGAHDRPLRLAGEDLEPISVKIDGETAAWSLDGGALVVPLVADTAVIETEVVLAPEVNSKLMGLYASGGNLCTQCESEGFRRITFHPDRPDVLSVYRVRMRADKARYPVLLANGNPVASGEGEDGTHWAEWHDPFPKPSYLFAMVAADLVASRDRFTTASGRDVDLAIWVREKDLAKTQHAMDSLKAAMRWDEQAYGREYDLDLFNIVAVDDFNFGAMENKGLNIFNSRYVLADQDTATDADFDAVAGVVAHEYFHNWSGNRVTCRDWFQLSLKEGFTVFRDQSFSADIGSEAVKRIEDVRMLRAAQFPEDNGPLAHPVRPDSYMEIANFYTATVYNKGAELIRMMRTILGDEAFRRGTDLYFERHDGEAATCDDFVRALEDASGIGLDHFKLWYSQAGTPRIGARLEHDAGARRATLHLTQSIPDTPGQSGKRPMAVPLRTALIGSSSGAEVADERVILLDSAQATVDFEDVAEEPLLSINRRFSAPVIIEADRKPGELERLAQADSDSFARFEALQDLMMGVLVAGARGEPANPEAVVDAMGATLRSNALDAAFKGEALIIPSESLVIERLDAANPERIHAVRDGLRSAVGSALGEELRAAQARTAPGGDLSPEAKGVRRLRAVALGLIASADPSEGARIAKAQYDAADNMTDRQAALATLASLDGAERDAALADFYARYRDDSLVIDKWFAIQAIASRPDTLDVVEQLRAHPDFTIRNPNRLRALASFAANPWVLHSGEGKGYRLLADLALEADSINPQVAARLIPPLGRWRRFAEPWASRMTEELRRIAAAPGLSKDVFEQVSKSLA